MAAWKRARSRWLLRAALVAGGLAALSVAAASPGVPGSSRLAPERKVEQDVLDDLAGGKGAATFWVLLREEADLSGAAGIDERGERGAFVVEELTSVAERSQAGLRALLKRRGAEFESFWIANAIKVTGGKALVEAIAARAEVERIVADRRLAIPKPRPASRQASVAGVEWNIDRIRAPEVWSSYGTRGEGIVVATIDTGVEFDHTALRAQYRGSLGDGRFDHNYNWFDPSSVCGAPSLVPCDNSGHGTHVTGTIVGEDGDPGRNGIGVAPGARWITAKGCETTQFCSFQALLAAGQWILAPTDLNGENPRPDLRPHVVNNSWGGFGGFPWYRETVDAWVAAGIFPAFGNGNRAPGCNTSVSPGDYTASYSAGAFNVNNRIAWFSSRGPSAFGDVKPNIAAPGVSVRSSVPGSREYASFSGTSTASPHVAGAVALLWSVSPPLERDVAATRALLDETAIDVAGSACGGTTDDNNVWGEGRLDAFAAVEQSPRESTGTLTGTVTNADDGSPLEAARIRVTGPVSRATTTDGSGRYRLVVPAGSYEVSAGLFAFADQRATDVDLREGLATVRDFDLEPLAVRALSGHVRDGNGSAVANATVTIRGTPIAPATTDASGFYSFPDVPADEYEVEADAGRCHETRTQRAGVTADETLDFELPQRIDAFGYRCRIQPVDWIEAGTVIPKFNQDGQEIELALPFPFTFYGQTYDSVEAATSFLLLGEQERIITNGVLGFLGSTGSWVNTAIPSPEQPNAAISPFWDFLLIDPEASSLRTEVLGAAPNRRFVIEWRNVGLADDTPFEGAIDFEVVLFENGRILFQYRGIEDDHFERAGDATIGLEDHTGTVAFQYSFNEASIEPGLALLFRGPSAAFVQGTVTDANDRLPVGGARVRALQGDTVIGQARTNVHGRYRLQLPLGTYRLETTARNYDGESAEVVLDEEDEVISESFVLRTGRADWAEESDLRLIVPQGETRTRSISLRNTGSRGLRWQVRELGGGSLPVRSTSAGEVIRSWTPAGIGFAWAVGYSGNVWLSDFESNRIAEFTVDGTPTGRAWSPRWGGEWTFDMAYDAGRDLMCQVEQAIFCWDPDTGNLVGSISGVFPWSQAIQRGLAYRPDDDTFYVGNWVDGTIYHVKGLSYADKGAVISKCEPPDPVIAGLAWSAAQGVLWQATNSSDDTVYRLNPDTCDVLGAIPHPNPGNRGRGLELDEDGNLWMVGQQQGKPGTVYLVDSGLPNSVDVPWLSQEPSAGTLGPGETEQIELTIDTSGLEPGVYHTTLFVDSNGARARVLRVAIDLIVPAHRIGVDAGASRRYVDRTGDTWLADQAYRDGSWGWVGRTGTESTGRPISGTEEDRLFQTQRGERDFLYRFDGLVPGVYQVELLFAEIEGKDAFERYYDVLVEDRRVLPAHDVAYEVEQRAAERRSFFVEIDDGRAEIRFDSREGEPLVAAVRVTHRPDRENAE